MATKAKKVVTKKRAGKVGAPPRGRPKLPEDEVRSGRISMRTYPEIAAKVRRNGTEWLEQLIRDADEAEG